ncbi:MAG: permease [Puniceicoccaceae bacterium]|nr:MAG: permease [Puniceicoccaceae bacterium]
MIQFLTDFIQNTWDLAAEMAPYLLFGFAVAGLLHVSIRKEFVQRWLGKPGLRSVVKASVLGLPMPLCSCSVIPVAVSLRKSGASKGSTASFLSSTPQTGVDSIFASYALLGGLFTAVRVLVAFTCGILTGYLIELFCKAKTPVVPEALSSAVSLSNRLDQINSLTPLNAIDSRVPPSPIISEFNSMDCCASQPAPKRGPIEALRYGFVTLPADLATALVIGLLLAGLITTWLPIDLLSGSLSSGPRAFLLATAISLPLYVCATASIPMAYALLEAGLSPGAALVFLIAGPATNTTTIAAVWKMLGRGATAIYLVSLLLISWLAGWLFNTALSLQANEGTAQHHEGLNSSLWQDACGLIMIGLLIFSAWKSRQVKANSSCAG